MTGAAGAAGEMPTAESTADPPTSGAVDGMAGQAAGTVAPAAGGDETPPARDVLLSDQIVAAANQTETEVVAEIDRILAWSREHSSRVGYFAALYWHVATTLSAALKAGEFQHLATMQELNRVFFGRYLDAVHRMWAGERATEAWQVAFDATHDDGLIVIQHLLLGANAHINFDLAIAVAETVAPADLAAFRPDYDRMNDLLGSLVAGMAADISRAWPLLRLISRISAGADDAIVRFSLRAAREDAWQTAVRLASMDPAARTAAIDARDAEVRDLARLVVDPGVVLRVLMLVLRTGERGSVRRIIHDLLHRWRTR